MENIHAKAEQPQLSRPERPFDIYAYQASDLPVDRSRKIPEAVAVTFAAREPAVQRATFETKKVSSLTSSQEKEMNFYKNWLGAEFAYNWMPLWGKKWQPFRNHLTDTSPGVFRTIEKDPEEHKKVNDQAFKYHAYTGAFLFAPWAVISYYLGGLSLAMPPLLFALGSAYLCMWLRYIYLKKKASGQW